MLVDVREGESGWEKEIEVPLGTSKASGAFLMRVLAGGDGRYILWHWKQDQSVSQSWFWL